MVGQYWSTPSTSQIYNVTTTTTTGAVPNATGNISNISTTPSATATPINAWYSGHWTIPAAWLIIIYCITSACTLLLLLCHGYLDFHLNLDFSHAAARQREMRRRRRHSIRLETWQARERRDAEEVETDMDEEEAEVERRAAALEVPGPIEFYSAEEQQHEQRASYYPGSGDTELDELRRRYETEARRRHEREARLLARLERHGLL